MKWILFIVGLILLPVSLCSGDIQAPERVDVGKLLPVSSTDTADIFIWTIPEGIDFEAVDSNRKLICAGLEGSYKFQLTTITMNWEEKKFVQSPQQMKIVIIGKALPPPKPPEPPQPDVPLQGLALEVYNWASTANTQRECGILLSGNYKTVAAKYAAMAVTIEQAMEELRTLNNKVLDTRQKKDSWAVFGSRLEEKLNSVWPMEKNLFVKFLNEVSLGLSYVK